MQWYGTSQGQQRLEIEEQLLAMDFPQMELMFCPDGAIRVHGWIGPNNLCSESHYVVAEYPENFPYSRPSVWLPNKGLLSGTPHVYSGADSELCIEHGDFAPDDPMSTVLCWATQWLALYENYLETGKRW